MHTIARRIDDDRVCFFIRLLPLFCEDFCFSTDELYICDTIFGRIFLSIRTRTFDKLDGVDRIEMLREEYTDRPRPSIEIEKDSSLVSNEVDRSRVEFLGSKGIHLEK